LQSAARGGAGRFRGGVDATVDGARAPGVDMTVDGAGALDDGPGLGATESEGTAGFEAAGPGALEGMGEVAACCAVSTGDRAAPEPRHETRPAVTTTDISTPAASNHQARRRRTEDAPAVTPETTEMLEASAVGWTGPSTLPACIVDDVDPSASPPSIAAIVSRNSVGVIAGTGDPAKSGTLRVTI